MTRILFADPDRQANILRLLAAGRACYLAKPFHWPDLITRIEAPLPASCAR